ncbi:hypothetical protein [Catenuloplanes japonicus]|uniref:hypothetical protein n=1 Tax=Catenuloplanes japonicus TaxID=33876 RepID=UPI0006900C6D|nr:hypothetical protein [Catenuloplanes japonicus]
MALNLAALTYADCHMPDTARAWCWRQFDAYATGGPYDEATAQSAIQPLINIGRLHTRAGQGTRAFHLHQAMFHAARHGTPFSLDGRTLDLRTIAATDTARRAVTHLLWKTLLSDGLKALCHAGQWEQARQQAHTHRGVGDRLLDGRQIEIIAAATTGDHERAHALIDASVVTEPWEHVIAACLRMIATPAAHIDSQPEAAEALVSSYDLLDTAPPAHLTFLVRAGLTVIDLVPGHDIAPVIRKLTAATTDDDAYTAAELLNHPSASLLDPSTIDALTATVTKAGLGQPIPAALDTTLTEAAHAACESLTRLVKAST